MGHIDHIAFRDEPKAAATRIAPMSVEWFRRLGDIPGLAYDTPSGVDSRRLRGHDAVPEVHTFHPRDNVPGPAQTLQWGNTSASPAHERAFTDMSAMTTAKLLRNVTEALELPG